MAIVKLADGGGCFVEFESSELRVFLINLEGNIYSCNWFLQNLNLAVSVGGVHIAWSIHCFNKRLCLIAVGKQFFSFSHDRKYHGSIAHDHTLKLWDLDDLLQGSRSTQRNEGEVIDSDSDEMDVDANPSKNDKGMMSVVVVVDVINGLQVYACHI
ncbi:hypothetical protein K1719_016221 [Acacia pycnantha]|nr:hypothetical protein K1719_016221 [Acacia pycnantha]